LFRSSLLARCRTIHTNRRANANHVASIARYAGDAHGRAAGNHPALVAGRQPLRRRPLTERIAVAVGVHCVPDDVRAELAIGGAELHQVLAVKGRVGGVVVDAANPPAEPGTQHTAAHRVVLHAIVVVADDVLGTITFGVSPVAVLIDGL